MIFDGQLKLPKDNVVLRLIALDKFVEPALEMMFRVANRNGASRTEFAAVLQANLIKMWSEMNHEASVHVAQATATEFYEMTCEPSQEVV